MNRGGFLILDEIFIMVYFRGKNAELAAVFEAEFTVDDRPMGTEVW